MRSGSPTILTANYQILHEGLKKKKKHYLLLPTSIFFFFFFEKCFHTCVWSSLFLSEAPGTLFLHWQTFRACTHWILFHVSEKKEDIFYIIKNNQVVELMKRSNTYKWIWAQEIFKQEHLLHFVKRKRNTFHIIYIIPTLSLEENLL